MRRLERRRRRGGDGRGPVTIQRAARGVADGIDEVRYRAVRAVRGDRPLVLALLGVIGLGVVLMSGPAQSYLDGRARVDALAVKVDALEQENERLGQRADDLEDPGNIELLAREQQGFIRPGEVPYTLVPPEVDRPQITAPRDGAPVEVGAWYVRAWETVRGWFG